MVWLIIFLILSLILLWIFFTPLELDIDTRIPQASLRWISIGRAIVIYEDEKWLLKIRILFFSRQWDLEELIFREKKKKRIKKVKRKRKKTMGLRKIFNLLKTFRVTQWQMAIDTGDNVRNAWLYSLNFLPYAHGHLYVNFFDENYLLLKIRNALWKLAYAFMR